MWANFLRLTFLKARNSFEYIFKYKKFFGYVIAFLVVLVYLTQLGWLSPLGNLIFSTISLIGPWLLERPFGLPNVILLIVFLWIICITVTLIKQSFDLSIVAGSFNENFKHGLINWYYSSGWKTLKDGKEFVLCISGTESEGMIKKGFFWSDYELSFETKIIKRASGWIIRAANPNRFFMLQIFMDDISFKDGNRTIRLGGPSLRPHYREIDTQSRGVWIPLNKDSIILKETKVSKIELMEWIKVKITVQGEDLNVFINGVHAFKYDLYKKGFATLPSKEDLKEQDPILIGDYRFGSCGFREASDEEALFKKVQVRPI